MNDYCVSNEYIIKFEKVLCAGGLILKRKNQQKTIKYVKKLNVIKRIFDRILLQKEMNENYTNIY